MIELALIVMMGGIMTMFWSLRKQQFVLHELRAMQPIVIQESARTPHQMTEAEKRVMRLVDDADILVRRLFLKKSISRSLAVGELDFSEYRWNRSTALLRRLNIYDGRSLSCSYADARLRLRRYLDTQAALARESNSFVPNV